jgi:hypothetical protein
MQPGSKEAEIMALLHERVFQPMLSSPTASDRRKQGVRMTVTRMSQRDAAGMIHYFWSAVVGTVRSTSFAAQMRREGFGRFEEAIEEFRLRFDKPRVIKPAARRD